jgi:hypothetical protein
MVLSPWLLTDGMLVACQSIIGDRAERGSRGVWSAFRIVQIVAVMQQGMSAAFVSFPRARSKQQSDAKPHTVPTTNTQRRE